LILKINFLYKITNDTIFLFFYLIKLLLLNIVTFNYLNLYINNNIFF
jgi:hypothetical protein